MCVAYAGVLGIRGYHVDVHPSERLLHSLPDEIVVTYKLTALCPCHPRKLFECRSTRDYASVDHVCVAYAGVLGIRGYHVDVHPSERLLHSLPDEIVVTYKLTALCPCHPRKLFE